jgi:hypothetical protein
MEVKRIALLRSSTSALITIVTLLTIAFALIFICSQGACLFVIWMILLIICCFFLLPVIILRKKRNEIELTGLSLIKLHGLLRNAQKIQIIQGEEEIVVKDHYTISHTAIRWYESYPPKIYDVVDGIKAGDIVLIDGARLIII